MRVYVYPTRKSKAFKEYNVSTYTHIYIYIYACCLVCIALQEMNALSLNHRQVRSIMMGCIQCSVYKFFASSPNILIGRMPGVTTL